MFAPSATTVPAASDRSPISSAPGSKDSPTCSLIASALIGVSPSSRKPSRMVMSDTGWPRARSSRPWNSISRPVSWITRGAERGLEDPLKNHRARADTSPMCWIFSSVPMNSAIDTHT